MNQPIDITKLKLLDYLSHDDYDGEIIVTKITNEYVYTNIGAIPISQLHMYQLVTKD